jgi:protein-tyrosine sulfotransferase
LRKMARGSTTVQISQAASEYSSDSLPVFLVGVFRSGTTLLRYALDSHPSIAIPPESDFLVPLGEVVATPRSIAGLASLGYDRNHVVARCQEFSTYFFANYAAAKGKPRWGDKSPLYVEHLDWISELYPNAQFVHIFRHPLDQVQSFTNGGKKPMVPIPPEFAMGDEDVRVRSARWWRSQVEAQILHLERFPEQSMAISYQQLCADPEKILRSVVSFLREPWVDDVLRFGATKHDFGMEDNKIGATKSFEFVGGGYQTWPDSVQSSCENLTLPVYRRAIALTR